MNENYLNEKPIVNKTLFKKISLKILLTSHMPLTNKWSHQMEIRKNHRCRKVFCPEPAPFVRFAEFAIRRSIFRYI